MTTVMRINLQAKSEQRRKQTFRADYTYVTNKCGINERSNGISHQCKSCR